MLSVLIPIYNFDIRLLVQKLHQQALLLDCPVEIICLDDASDKEFQDINSTLSTLEKVRYIPSNINRGRSKIRNYLAELANYDYLLFMDCDSMPISPEYLLNYVKSCTPSTLLYGGRVYQGNIPEEAEHFFHWKYGKNREEQSAQKRVKHSYQSFMTNNFLIPKSLFTPIGFDETLTQYGHEDTLFGLELKKRSIPILHLDNPLEHIGIEINKVFLRKSRQAIENLVQLQRQYNLEKDIKLLRFYVKTSSIHLPLLLVFYLSKSLIEYNLCSRYFSLKFFDFYKLGYLIHCMRKEK